MTQQNEAIRLAVEALKPFANVAEQIKRQVKDSRWLETPLFFMGDDVDPQKWTLTGKAFNDAMKSLETLRPLLDQTSAGVGDLHRRIDWTSCACQFNEHDNQTKWCSVHAELRDEVARLRALTQADQQADKDERRALLDKIDRTLDYFRDEFPAEKDVWADPISAYAGGISANDLLKIKRALSGPEPVEKSPYRDPEWNDLYPNDGRE